MKITERILKDVCTTANTGVLKNWSFGLKIERQGAGFVLRKVYRQPGRGEEKITNMPLPAREAMCFIEGFTTAATLANEPIQNNAWSVIYP